MENAWLDPQGKIHEVPFCGHNQFASKMIKEEMGDWEAHEYLNDKHIYPYQWLYEKGWVRIKYNTAYSPKVQFLGGCINLTEPQRNTMDPPMNSRQLRVAKLICEEVGEDFHRAINDKRWW